MCLLSWVAASVNVAHGQQAAGQIRDPVYAGHMMAGVEGMRTGDFVAAMREFRGALDARPNDFRALVQLGRAQLGGNDLQGASQTYATLKVGFPDLPAGPFGLGQVEMARNNPEAAQLALQEALQLDPDHYGANFYFARALQAAGDVTGAAATYQRAIAINPTVRLAPLALANLALGTGGESVAVDLLRQLQRDWPDDPQVLLALGVAQGRSSQFNEAGDTLRRVLTLDPSNGVARYNLALVAVGLQDWPAAEALLDETLQATPDDLASRLLLARVLEGEGRVEEAHDVLERGVELSPGDRTLRMARAALLAAYSPQSDEAMAIYEQLVAEQTDDAGARRALAEVYINSARLEQASQQIERLLTMSPADPDLLLEAGRLRSQLARPVEARQALDALMAQSPDHVGASYELALLDLREELYGDAAARLTRIIEMQPYRSNAHFNLGRSLRGLGRDDEAQAEMARFEKLSEFDERVSERRAVVRGRPGDADAHLALAELYVEGERWVAAQEVLQKILRLRPVDQRAAALREIVEQALSGSDSSVAAVSKGSQFEARLRLTSSSAPLASERAG